MMLPSQKRRIIAVTAVTWIKVSLLTEKEVVTQLSEVAPAWFAEFEEMSADDRRRLYVVACVMATIYSPHLLPSSKYSDASRWLMARSAKHYAGINFHEVYEAEVAVFEYIEAGAHENLALGAWLQREVRGTQALGVDFNKESLALGAHFRNTYSSWHGTVDFGFDCLMTDDFTKASDWRAKC